MNILSVTALLFFLLPSLPPSELEQTINALQTKYLRLNTLTADFTQIYNSPGERMRRESGRLQLKKPGKMRWDYAAPEAKLYVSDGRMIYEYIPADRTATRASVKESGDLRAPFMFLLGRGKLRQAFSRIEFSTEAPVRAGNRVLRMVPKHASEFRELLLEVEPHSLNLARLSFIKAGNVRIDFLFSNWQENTAIAEAVFIFKLPAGVTLR